MGYRSNVTQFVHDVLTAAVIDNDDYVLGSQRIDFHEDLLDPVTAFEIYDPLGADRGYSARLYEEALYERLLSPKSSMLVLIGGLGSGKSTVVRYMLATIRERATAIRQAYPCECQPCVRRPIVIDCIDVDKTLTTNECEAYVLMLIRREIYNRLIDEWVQQRARLSHELTSQSRKVLRRLLIANDIYHWADAEAIEFPSSLHTTDLELDIDLLTSTPDDDELTMLVGRYTKASNGLDRSIEEAISDVGVAKRFTSLVIGFWLQRCNQQSLNNLIIVDNLDQQPTDHIEQVVNHLHDISARNAGARMLVPLRPSSIVPHGFTRNPDYMYHYGPNCFEMIYQRLLKNVLTVKRDDLMQPVADGGVFATSPSTEEVTSLLVATYIYALISLNGAHRDSDDELKPDVHADHSFLHRIAFPGAAVAQLTETVSAIVGTCGRYATQQLRRYFHSVYLHPFFLKQVEGAGLAMGASVRLNVPYGQIVSAVLGRQDGDTDATGLANLYNPTEFRSNPDRPTLAKLRILTFLSARRRVKVRAVVRELAQFGIPFELSIDALNYLHEKNRLLLWFSKNSELPRDGADLDQYVVISEHGQAYLKDLAGDFEYVWFCAYQIRAGATSDDATLFRQRLGDYKRLMSDFASTEWKQMRFQRCSATTAWRTAAPEDVKGDEMLTLYLLYSSFERGLRSAKNAVQKRDAEYVRDVYETIDELADLILHNQDAYETYYGDNGYRLAYASKISRCGDAVRSLREQTEFQDLAPKIAQVLDSWTRPVRRLADFGEDLGAVKDDGKRQVWDQFVAGIPLSSMRPDEPHARESLAAALRPFVVRRSKLCDLLNTRFPTLGLVLHNVRLLTQDAVLLRDAAQRLAAYTRPLMEWVEAERGILSDILVQLESNSFTIPDMTAKVDMDVLKDRANTISHTLVELARRLGATRTDHLTFYWNL